jgi:hypothetical protein
MSGRHETLVAHRCNERNHFVCAIHRHDA